MNKIKIIALFGASGAGKDTLQHWLVENLDNAHSIVSCTTRPPRDYEQNGKDYFFTTTTHFLTAYLTDEILEFSTFNNWYYGTLRSSLKSDKINVGVFNIEGIKSLIKHKELDVLPVWIETDEKTRLIRCLNRERDPDCKEICRRFLADHEDFKLENIDFNYEYYNNSQYNNYIGLLNRPKIKAFLKKDKIN